MNMNTMGNYITMTIMLDREQIYRAMMAEYALVVAGKSEEEAPMQYAKCDLPGIFKVLYNEELGVMCSKIGGDIEHIDDSADGLTEIRLRIISRRVCLCGASCLCDLRARNMNCSCAVRGWQCARLGIS